MLPARHIMGKNPDVFETAFDTYSVIGIIGQGGAGRVFSVVDSGGHKFAIKCLFPQRITKEKRKRFKNEIDFCRKQRHRNLMQVIDSGLSSWDRLQTPFYVMPYYPKTLRVLLVEKILANRVLPFFSQILDGVEAAHLLGVIHRDLKPENILYDPDKETFVIADFGIAHFAEDIIATSIETEAASKMANLGYSAPEQRIKGGSVDSRADIYALGLILNEMFTGLIPHGTDYKQVASVAPGYAYLDNLIDNMIRQSPDARPSTIEDVKKDLIGRKNSFVALQQLDIKKREVVDASAPQEFIPIKLVSVDWQKDTLIFALDRNPPEGWIRRFHTPRGGHQSIMGYGPEHYHFNDRNMSLRAEERIAQQLVDFCKRYIDAANTGYQRDIQEAAGEQEARRRIQLEEETAEAEKKARILKNIKI